MLAIVPKGAKPLILGKGPIREIEMQRSRFVYKKDFKIKYFSTQHVPKQERKNDVCGIKFEQMTSGLLEQHSPVNEVSQNIPKCVFLCVHVALQKSLLPNLHKLSPQGNEVAIGSYTSYEDDLLHLIMLQNMLADDESRALHWSAVLRLQEKAQRRITEAQLCRLARKKRLVVYLSIMYACMYYCCR